MKKYIPNMYKQNIFDINYDKLISIGIKCLVFDLDNTIALIDEKEIPNDVLSLFKKLKENFEIVIISNNTKKRIEPFCKPFNTTFISFAMKPFTFSFKRIGKKFNFKAEEMAMIGDQLMTDIKGGNKFGMFTILTDPLGKKDLKITTLNRYLENKKIKKMTKKNILKRGTYYE